MYFYKSILSVYENFIFMFLSSLNNNFFIVLKDFSFKLRNIIKLSLTLMVLNVNDNFYYLF